MNKPIETFLEALVSLNEGKAVARRGWEKPEKYLIRTGITFTVNSISGRCGYDQEMLLMIDPEKGYIEPEIWCPEICDVSATDWYELQQPCWHEVLLMAEDKGEDLDGKQS